MFKYISLQTNKHTHTNANTHTHTHTEKGSRCKDKSCDKKCGYATYKLKEKDNRPNCYKCKLV